MSLFRQHFERMLFEHDKRSLTRDDKKYIAPVEDTSESYTAFDNSCSSSCIDEMEKSDSTSCDESTDNEDDDETEEDETDSSDDDDDDDDDDSYSDVESMSSFVDNVINEIDAVKLQQPNVSKEDAKSGLFLSVEMVEMLRKSTSNLTLGTTEKYRQMDTVMRSASLSNGCTSNERGSGIVLCHQTQSAKTSSYDANEKYVPPLDILKSILSEKGYTNFPVKREDLNHFYIEERNSGYTTALLAAIRQGDLDTVKRMKESGANLQCCNQFRESTVHAVARRGQTHILKYLLEEANVTLYVSCDTGRNPLHDACWSANPNFECIEYILEQCADLLLLGDKRGFTPLDYIPKDSYRRWGNFLESQRSMLLEKLLTSQNEKGEPYFTN